MKCTCTQEEKARETELLQEPEKALWGSKRSLQATQG